MLLMPYAVTFVVSEGSDSHSVDYVCRLGSEPDPVLPLTRGLHPASCPGVHSQR